MLNLESIINQFDKVQDPSPTFNPSFKTESCPKPFPRKMTSIQQIKMHNMAHTPEKCSKEEGVQLVINTSSGRDSSGLVINENQVQNVDDPNYKLDLVDDIN